LKHGRKINLFFIRNEIFQFSTEKQDKSTIWWVAAQVSPHLVAPLRGDLCFCVERVFENIVTEVFSGESNFF